MSIAWNENVTQKNGMAFDSFQGISASLPRSKQFRAKERVDRLETCDLIR